MKKILTTLKQFLLISSYPFYSLLIFIPIVIFNLNNNKLSNKEQLLTNLFASLSYLIFIIVIYRKKLKKDYVDFKKNSNNYLNIGRNYWLTGLGLMMIFNIVINIFLKNGPTNEQLVQQLIDENPLYMIYSAVIFAPIVEELLFRETLKDIIKNETNYIILSGFLFGLIHIIFNLNNSYEFLYAIPYGIIGLTFALSYVKTKNIYTPIIYHAFHNGILITISIIINLYR